MYGMFAALLGALTAVMIALNGELAQYLGNAASGVVAHLTGLLLVVLLIVLARAERPLRQAVPPLLLGGGALGALTVLFANIGVLALGVSLTLALGLLGQTLSALAIDHFGWLGAPAVPFDRRRLATVALIVAGIAVMACV
ncbi:MAG TPA: DMT family transporter [Roseiflexaceae bacterium]|nr:DMT family transporter [Roseiflexaceae bacterium]